MNEKDYIEINKASYDIVAEEYKTKYKNNDGANKFYDILQEFVLNKKNDDFSKMLEIGPGVGTLLKIFEEKGFRTTAVELSENMASLACENSSNSVIINNNILEINFMPKQFDFILAMAVIHNFPEEDLIKLLDKIKVWLKDDGFFILDTTNNQVTETGFFEKEDYNNNVVRYRRKWKKEDLESFMEKQGFYIQDSVVYKDSTSNKEWLIYSFKVAKSE
ncbi:MAG: class I SAM-dependent methyltransferase [Tenericutes bacterium]|nr:class I SAM-dependent methyltransferase [Mycoplasmatota bacterium]